MSEQQSNLNRVSARIGEVILSFYYARLRGNSEFHASELRKFVQDATGLIAPASPDRVLRALRREGRLNYEVVSRRESLYRFTLV